MAKWGWVRTAGRARRAGGGATESEGGTGRTKRRALGIGDQAARFTQLVYSFWGQGGKGEVRGGREWDGVGGWGRAARAVEGLVGFGRPEPSLHKTFGWVGWWGGLAQIRGMRATTALLAVQLTLARLAVAATRRGAPGTLLDIRTVRWADSENASIK